MKDIKLIAFDLDGTLLTTDKQVTKRTEDVLKAAAERGIAIVPATGRYIKTVPQAIKDMEAVTHFITINGAYVFNAKTGEDVYRSEIPNGEALEILRFLDEFDVTYDCYTNNCSFMTGSMKDKVENYVEDVFYLKMLYGSREPVEELKKHLMSYAHDIQKMMCYTKQPELKALIMKRLEAQFKDIKVTSSIKDNIEINAAGAHKGIALRTLAQHLGIGIENTIAFGDSYNDIPLLEAAGVSVCMENGAEDVKKISDIIAPANDDDGVAYIIEQEILK